MFPSFRVCFIWLQSFNDTCILNIIPYNIVMLTDELSKQLLNLLMYLVILHGVVKRVVSCLEESFSVVIYRNNERTEGENVGGRRRESDETALDFRCDVI